MLDFLNLLAEHSYLDLDIADEQNWTTLDRVAAVGTSPEVNRLVRLGANPHQEALPLRWKAIHQAVFHGNAGTFEALLPEYGSGAASMIDERGWTLLHIAASADHSDMIRRLLEMGSDPEAQSKPFNSHMPEVLHSRSCTLQEAAAAQSQERSSRYLGILQDLRLATGYVIVGEDGDVDEEAEFWEAQESLG